VSDLLGKPGAHRSVQFSVGLPLAMDMARVVSDVDVDLRFDATSRDIVASGRIDFDIVATCNRCLRGIDQHLSPKFSQVFGTPSTDDEDAAEVLPLGPQGEIDLESTIVDEIGVTLPLSSACRDDCLGLCPTCGTDLNREPCEGHEDLLSSPFAVLQDFLEN
jgi:uncharacterized protein